MVMVKVLFYALSSGYLKEIDFIYISHLRYRKISKMKVKCITVK